MTANKQRVAAAQAQPMSPPPEVFERHLELRRKVTIVLLSLFSPVLLTISFPGWPLECTFLAYVALVPWGLALAGGIHGRWAVMWGWLAGLMFWAINLYWLWWITLAGYAAAVIYLSVYWLVAALILRAALRRFWPMWICLPVLWVALEYARGWVIGGFPWFFLAHSQYDQTRLIQLADVTGQYGVSFFVAMVNGMVMDLLSLPLFARVRHSRARIARRGLFGVVVVLLAAGAMLVYGTYRLGQTKDKEHSDVLRRGPVIGIVQQAFPISLYHEGATQEKTFQEHFRASRRFVSKGCDLVIWPESMLPQGVNSEFVNLLADGPQRTKLQGYVSKMGQLARELNSAILAGGTTGQLDLLARRDRDRLLLRNSALWFDRKGKITAQYSKRHLVPFSEYVPFKKAWPRLHESLRKLVPQIMPQLEPGSSWTRFELDGKGQSWALASPICFEGTFARVCRQMMMQDGQKVVDILANLSNDGWFVRRWNNRHYSSTEHTQHLVQYCFRAIECRVPVVRAVNTGISASIDSDGRIIERVNYHGQTMIAGSLLLSGEGSRRTAGMGYQLAPQVLVDSRVSVYSIVGDVFASAVAISAVVMTALLAWRRRRSRQEGTTE